MHDSRKLVQRFDRRGLFRTRTLALMLACLVPWVGCAREDVNQSPAVPAEPTFQAQLAAVKEGQSDSIRLIHHHLEPSELADLVQLDSLRELRLDFCPVTDDQAETIAALEGLEIVNFPRSALTHVGVERLAQSPQLRLVRLGGEGIDDEAVRYLAQHPEIRFLHFLDCSVSDESLEAIAEMERLQSFYIDNTPITDEGLSQLIKKRPRLHIHVDDAHPRGHNPGHSH